MDNNDRIEEKEVDFKFAENLDFRSTPPNDNRRRNRSAVEFSYLKLSIAIICAGLTLFFIFKAYNRYEAKKEIEAAIEAVNEMNREMKREIDSMLKSDPKRPKLAQSKAGVKEKRHIEMSDSVNLTPEERAGYFKDSDGVWRNDPNNTQGGIRDEVQSLTRDAVEPIKSLIMPSKPTEELYQDENGVWRNRPTSTGSNIISEGLHGVSTGLVEGMNDVIKSTAGAVAEESFKNQLKGHKRTVEKLRRESQYQDDIKQIRELKKSKQDFSGYERFEPTATSEGQSEWEYFEDNR